MPFQPAYIPSRQAHASEPLTVSITKGRVTFTFTPNVIRDLKWAEGTPLRLELDLEAMPHPLARLVEWKRSATHLHATGGRKLRWQCLHTGDMATLFVEGPVRGLNIIDKSPTEGLTFEIPDVETRTEEAGA